MNDHATKSDESVIQTPPHNMLTINGPKGMMVSIDTLTGKISFGEHYNLDEAAKTFWTGIELLGPIARIKILEAGLLEIANATHSVPSSLTVQRLQDIARRALEWKHE